MIPFIETNWLWVRFVGFWGRGWWWFGGLPTEMKKIFHAPVFFLHNRRWTITKQINHNIVMLIYLGYYLLISWYPDTWQRILKLTLKYWHLNKTGSISVILWNKKHRQVLFPQHTVDTSRIHIEPQPGRIASRFYQLSLRVRCLGDDKHKCTCT